MTPIEQLRADYNFNWLSKQFDNNTPIIWDVVNGTMNYEVLKIFNKSSLNIQPNDVSLDVTFKPNDPNDYEIEIKKTGEYVFSFRVLIEANSNTPNTLKGKFILKSTTDIEMPFAIGVAENMVNPYNVWVTMYQSISLTQGDIYQLQGQIDANSFQSNILNVYFDGFSLEYVEDKHYKIPSIYTKL